jgi:hypothetical protein
MTYLFKLARRGARLRALLLPALAVTFAACNTDQLTNSSDEPSALPASEPAAAPVAASFLSSGFRGGIPFGTFAQPNSAFGGVYNGALRNIYPEVLLENLADIKARGGRVVLMLAGNERTYKDGDGHFSLSKWKERVNRFRGVNFSSYIADGTIIGHYVLDEPNDPANWNGVPVSGAVVEEMAKHSKQLWPSMKTIVRTEPGHLLNGNVTYRYLDAAWAQYAQRKGDVRDFLNRNVSDAKRLGLGLVAGLNILMGSVEKTPLTGSQIESWGSILLSDPYICAFISWKYDERLLARADVKAAMSRLSQKAQDHAPRSCSGGGDQSNPPPPPPPPPSLPSVKGIVLTATRQVKDGVQGIQLTWAGAAGSRVKLYRDGVLKRTTTNDGRAMSFPRRPGTYEYRVCETVSSKCSNRAAATIR